MPNALIMLVVAARPNFMKAAPVLAQIHSWNAQNEHVERQLSPFVVHTGQHYDTLLSEVFFQQLGLSEPDCNLGVGSSSHGAQTADVMRALEPLLVERKPDLVMVFGDVNSTLAAALVTSKLGIPLAHVEAGLRSGDRAMPEEINRLVTDQLADLLFVTERSALANLEREGIDSDRVHFVGNTMIDALLAHCERFDEAAPLDELSIRGIDYACVTLHRPSNVDDGATLTRHWNVLLQIAERLPVVFPVHPRTRARLDALGFVATQPAHARLLLTEPLDYLAFLGLVKQARLVVTDSGGIQEETTVLGVPCLTLRTTTERPVTTTEGTNRLVPPDDETKLLEAVHDVLSQPRPAPVEIELWDGHAAERIVDVVAQYLARHEPRSAAT